MNLERANPTGSTEPRPTTLHPTAKEGAAAPSSTRLRSAPRRRTRLRDVAEYLPARGVLAATRLLPARALGPLSRVLGRLLYRVIGSRRRAVRDNVRRACPEWAEGTADSIGRGALANLCLSFMELARLPRNPEAMKRRVTFQNPAALAALREAQAAGGVVIAASHFAAYEVMGLVGPLYDMPCTILVRPLDNPLLESWLRRSRQRFGQRIVGNRGGLRDLMGALRQGHLVGVLIDLNHRRPRRVWVRYFGIPAATAPTAAVLAVKCGRPIVSVVTHRTGVLSYTVEIGALHQPRPDAAPKSEIQRLLQVVTDELEEQVRRHPDQWLWTHNRWKTRPTPDEPQ